MKRTIFRLLLVGFMVLHSNYLLAQRPGPITDPGRNPTKLNTYPNTVSPNVVSLGVFGDVPISKYTGHPEINIPLVNLKNGDISVSVDLNYNASAVKPDNHPGWTGLGWDLNVFGGGVISRKIKDKSDEDDRFQGFNFHSDPPTGFLSGGYYSAISRSALLNSNWETVNPEIELNSQRDTEPDEFAFKFMGNSGKFFLDEQGHWQVRSEQNIKVEFNGEFIQPPFPIASYKKIWESSGIFFYKLDTRAFKGFILTDDSGVKYYFGGSNDAIEYNINYMAQAWDDWLASSWHLTKVIWPNGKEVVFTYQREKMIVDLHLTHSLSLTNAYVNNQQDCNSSAYGGFMGGQVISPVYLKSVTTSWGESLTFYSSKSREKYYDFTKYENLMNAPNTNYYGVMVKEFSGDVTVEPAQLEWRKLDSIKWNVNMVPLKTLRFNYNQYSNTSIPRERLMLTGLTEISSKGISKSPYFFKYSLEMDTKDRFPNYLAELSDHWGNYNNIKSSGDSLEYYSFFRGSTFDYSRNKIATRNNAILHTNLLTKIVYPTKGSSVFIYEPGQYSAALDSTRQHLIQYDNTQYGGAPRIRTILDATETINGYVKRRDYYYVKGYKPGLPLSSLKSSGTLSGVPKYNYNYIEEYPVVFPNNVTANIKVVYDLRTVNPVLPLNDEFFYNPVGYTEVVEVQTSPSNPVLKNGYKIYRYTGFDDGHFDDKAKMLAPVFFPYYPVSSRAFERGRLKSEQTFDNDGRILEATKTFWGNHTIGSDNERDQYVRAFMINGIDRCSIQRLSGGGSAFTSFELGAYRLYYYPFRPLKQETTKYFLYGSDSLVTAVSYKYDYTYKVLKEKIFKGSSGEELKTTYRYPHEVAPTATWFLPSDAYTKMKESNMIGTPIETINSKLVNGNELITSADVNRFALVEVKNADGTNKFLPATVAKHSMESIVPIPKSSFQNYSAYINEFAGVSDMFDSRMKQRSSYSYDNRGNVISALRHNGTWNDSPGTCLIWNEKGNDLIAEVKNGSRNRVALSNFESQDDWDTGGSIISGDCYSGKKCVDIHNSEILITKSMMPAGRYLLSYMSKYSRLTLHTASDGVNYIHVLKENLGSEDVTSEWSYSHLIIELLTDNYITLEGGEGRSLADDIRLIPEGAQVTTYTYEPGNGISSVTDSKGQTVFYEYDDFQRLKNVRDQKKNILKNVTYHYKQL